MGKTVYLRIPIVGEIEQTGVPPKDPSTLPPQDIEGIWAENGKRFMTRARASGAINGPTLRGESMTQVNMGWTKRPRPLDGRGNLVGDPRVPRLSPSALVLTRRGNPGMR